MANRVRRMQAMTIVGTVGCELLSLLLDLDLEECGLEMPSVFS